MPKPSAAIIKQRIRKTDHFLLRFCGSGVLDDISRSVLRGSILGLVVAMLDKMAGVLGGVFCRVGVIEREICISPRISSSDESGWIITPPRGRVAGVLFSFGVLDWTGRSVLSIASEFWPFGCIFSFSL